MYTGPRAVAAPDNWRSRTKGRITTVSQIAAEGEATSASSAPGSGKIESMVVDKTYTLDITGHCPDGLPGTDSSPGNPLWRALDSLLTTGRPFTRFHACYLKPRPLAQDPVWFGTFVYSAGDRLIFFPGFAQIQQHVRRANGQSPMQQQAFEADHMSLEADRQSWHITTRRSTDHVGSNRKSGFPTADLGDGRVLWFGLSIPHPRVLRPLRESTKAIGQVNARDACRRADVFMDAREGVEFNDLLFNTGIEHVPQPSYAHFTVIVGPCHFQEYTGERLALPIGSPFAKLPEQFVNVPMRRHRVHLTPYADIEITTALLPGEITVPFAFTSPD